MSGQIGVVFWKNKTEFLTHVTDTISELGYEVVDVAADERLPRGLDVLLICGPFGSLVPVINQISQRPGGWRPRVALWMTEQFTNPKMPEWLHRWLGWMRSSLERKVFYAQREEAWQIRPQFARMASRALRLRYYGDLRWLEQEGILDVLAVGSKWIAHYLSERGFPAMVAYIGHTPAWGAPLGLERDISVLWLGKVATARRRAVLEQIAATLRQEGIEMLRVDGENHPYVFGEERTRLLNRSKITLNVLRTPWDNHSLRYFLAAANRSLIVTEPTAPHTPFVPGKHLVEAELEQMAQTIRSYLADDEARRTITEQAHRLVTGELTMKRSIARIVDRALEGQATHDEPAYARG